MNLNNFVENFRKILGCDRISVCAQIQQNYSELATDLRRMKVEIECCHHCNLETQSTFLLFILFYKAHDFCFLAPDLAREGLCVEENLGITVSERDL